MTISKIICGLSAIFALMCLTGYDCPQVDFKAQTIALVVSCTICAISALISAKNGQ